MNDDLPGTVIDFEEDGRAPSKSNGAQSGPEVVALGSAFRHGAKTETIGLDPFNKTKCDFASDALGNVCVNGGEIRLSRVTNDDRIGLQRRDFVCSM